MNKGEKGDKGVPGPNAGRIGNHRLPINGRCGRYRLITGKDRNGFPNCFAAVGTMPYIIRWARLVESIM